MKVKYEFHEREIVGVELIKDKSAGDRRARTKCVAKKNHNTATNALKWTNANCIGKFSTGVNKKKRKNKDKKYYESFKTKVDKARVKDALSSIG